MKNFTILLLILLAIACGKSDDVTLERELDAPTITTSTSGTVSQRAKPTNVNIYIEDDSLTGNRILYLNGHELYFRSVVPGSIRFEIEPDADPTFGTIHLGNDNGIVIESHEDIGRIFMGEIVKLSTYTQNDTITPETLGEYDAGVLLGVTNSGTVVQRRLKSYINIGTAQADTSLPKGTMYRVGYDVHIKI